jgi:hypothetical protein
MIKPTIGRRVWYWPDTTSDDHRIYDRTQAFDAGVVLVLDDHRVTLDVTDHYGRHFVVGNCYLWQGADDVDPAHRERPKEGFAEWMPYQRAVAAKA